MKYLVSGMLGDCIHSLVVCKFNYDTTGELADIFITDKEDHPFINGLEFAYNELKPVLEIQPWVRSFNIFKGETVDVNLDSYRNSTFLYKDNWLNIYFKSFLPEFKVPNEYSWIEIEKIPRFENALLVNRSTKRYGGLMPLEVEQNFLSICKEYDERYFICFDTRQYDEFQFKDEFNLLTVKNLYEYFLFIKSCKLFIGNQSAPFALAAAMNVPRVLEILKSGNMVLPDGVHYYNDINYYKNFWII